MKSVICLLIFLTTLLFCPAIAETSPPNTDAYLSFYGIPWGISRSDFNALMSSMYHSDYKKNYFNNDYCISFGQSDHIDSVYSNNIGEGTESFNLNRYYAMGGHAVKHVSADFYRYIDSYLYSVTVSFAPLTENLKKIDINDQYSDLKSKLTQLYGEPYTSSGHFDGYAGNHDWVESVWVSTTQTGMILRKEYNYSTTTVGFEDNVTLQYGDISTSKTFQIIDQEIEANKEEAISSIANSFDGL